jgi:hypothetical protein
MRILNLDGRAYVVLDFNHFIMVNFLVIWMHDKVFAQEIEEHTLKGKL